MSKKVKSSYNGNKRRIFTASLIVFLSVYIFLPILNAHAIIADQVLAVVNKTPITLYDFAKFNKPAFENYEQMQKDASNGIFNSNDEGIMTQTKKIINFLVDKLLIKQEEQKAALYIPPKKIDAYIQAVAKSNNMTISEFKKMLKTKHISFHEYKKQLEKHFMQFSLLRKIYGSKMNITNAMLLNYYKKNIEEFRGREEEDLKLIFISVPTDASKILREKIYRRILHIRNIAIKGDVSFSSLASKYSDDPSEKNGGRIGYVYKDKLSPAFSSAAFKLKVGQISKIIPSKFGYTLLKSVGKKYGSYKSFRQVKSRIFMLLEKIKTDKYLSKLVKKARKDSFIKLLLVS